MKSEFIHGDISNKYIISILKRKNIRVIFCVYDSIKRLFSALAFNASNYILIVDEIHNATIQYDFRPEALKGLAIYKTKFRKVINLTGTPEGVLFNESRNVIFESR